MTNPQFSSELFVLTSSLPLPISLMNAEVQLRWRGQRVRVETFSSAASNERTTEQQWDEEHNWDALDERRVELVMKSAAERTTDAEEDELAELQRMAGERLDQVEPLPIAKLKAFQEELKAKGLWNLP